MMVVVAFTCHLPVPGTLLISLPTCLGRRFFSSHFTDELQAQTALSYWLNNNTQEMAELGFEPVISILLCSPEKAQK
jgi:hypothetical protein